MLCGHKMLGSGYSDILIEAQLVTTGCIKGAFIHSMKNLPGTFGTICLKVLDHMAPKNNFIFSTDSYCKDSIKTQECLKRGMSEKFIVDGPATRKPPDMQIFLRNEENKQQLFDLLLRVWKSNEAATRTDGCSTAILIVEGTAHKLVSSDGKIQAYEYLSCIPVKKRLTQGSFYT